MELTRDEGRARLRELIHGIDTAVLTTAGTDGSLHSRPMAALDTDDGALWFFTDDFTGKARDVALNPQVGVTYAEPERHRFVSVSGKAELVHDRERMKQLWRPQLQHWFARGLEDPDLALLHIDIESAHYWDAPGGKPVPVASARTADPPEESGALPIKTRIGPDNLS